MKMKLKARILEQTILKAIKTFPALVVTGPRQSGKTTLFKMLFSKTHTLVSLEDPDYPILGWPGGNSVPFTIFSLGES
jgi:predicted AAA+ superfamily ATPase